MDILKQLKNQIIVSVQAMPGEPLYESSCILNMAKSVVNLSGCKALRLAGKRDIKNIKKNMPDTIIIGITKPKKIPDNFLDVVYITPTIADCKEIIEAGCDIIAFDGTQRKRPNKETLKDIIEFIKNNDKLAMADIATFDEAKNAYELGCDIISTTLSGYTKETKKMPDEPDFNLVKKIKSSFDVFTVLEGKIWEQKDVKKAFEVGSDAVVIGSAITRPQLIYKRFLKGVKTKNE